MGLPIQTWARLVRLAALVALLGGCERTLGALTDTERIEPAELAAELEGPEPPLVIDVRDLAAYERLHLPGAVWAPRAELDTFFRQALAHGPRSVVTVCEKGPRAALATPWASAAGARRVRSLAGGLDRWQVEGRPTESGPATAPAVWPPPSAAPLALSWLAWLACGPLPALVVLLLALLWAALRRAPRPGSTPLRWALLALALAELGLVLDPLTSTTSGVRPLAVGSALTLALGLGLLAWGVARSVDAPWQRGLRRLAPTLGLLALWPWLVPLWPSHAPVRVGALELELGLPLGNLLFEQRLLPVVACGLLLVTAGLLRLAPLRVTAAALPGLLGLGLLLASFARIGLQRAWLGPPHGALLGAQLAGLLVALGLGALLRAPPRPAAVAPRPPERA